MSFKSWLSSLFQPRRRSIRNARRSPRPLLEQLEDRVTPATFNEVGATLNLDLNAANESVSVVSMGTSYSMTLNAGHTWSRQPDRLERQRGGHVRQQRGQRLR